MVTKALVISNRGQALSWKVATISSAPIFLTADCVWGPDESHYEPHRYIVSGSGA
jgi:hypothetical protein